MNIKLIATRSVLVAIGWGILATQSMAIAQSTDNSERIDERVYDENTHIYVHLDEDDPNGRVLKHRQGGRIYRDSNDVEYIEGNGNYTWTNESESAKEQYRLGELKANGANVPDVVNIYSP